MSKRKSFFEERFQKEIKKVCQKEIDFTNIENMLELKRSDQEKLTLILKVCKLDQIEKMERNSKALNFALIGCCGMTAEAVVFDNNTKLKMINILQQCVINVKEYVSIKNWRWYNVNAPFNNFIHLDNKILISSLTEMKVLENQSMKDESILDFKLMQCYKRLHVNRKITELKTVMLDVVKDPVRLYGNLLGVLVSDGLHFGIVAVMMNSKAEPDHSFCFGLAELFIMKNVKCQLLEVSKFHIEEKDYFLLNDESIIPILYAYNDTEIVQPSESERNDFTYFVSADEVSYPPKVSESEKESNVKSPVQDVNVNHRMNVVQNALFTNLNEDNATGEESSDKTLSTNVNDVSKTPQMNDEAMIEEALKWNFFED